jgi:glycosyltransferase involved in cell wall biosynthesis
MRVVFNSVEPMPGDQPERLSALLAPLKGRRVVGAVIRLNQVKRLDLLIQAVALLNEKNGGDIAVLIVGDGPCREFLRSQAKSVGVDLLLPGPAYTDNDLKLVYSALSVCVVPEAVGLTAVQSMTYGVPVISDDDPYSQMPEWESIRQDVTGGIYRKGDVADLANEIERWLVRVDRDAAIVARACTTEVQERWTAPKQAELIRKAILDHI